MKHHVGALPFAIFGKWAAKQHNDDSRIRFPKEHMEESREQETTPRLITFMAKS